MARVLVVTRSTVVIHIPCYAIRPAIGFLFLGPFYFLVALLPRVVAPCVAVGFRQLLVHHFCLIFNLLGLTILDIDAPPPQFAGPGAL